MLSFFRERRRITNDYSAIDELLLPIIARINPHFKLSKNDYYKMTDEELLIMVEEFEDHNNRVKHELKKGQARK